MSEAKYSILFDEQGQLFGTHISADLWERIQDEVLPILRKACGEGEPEQEPFPEPLSDWNDLLKYWDLPYPPESSVICGECGAETEDWQADTPRKFRLKAANFGGLATFECQQCNGRVTKRHFKDGIQFKTVPFAG